MFYTFAVLAAVVAQMAALAGFSELLLQHPEPWRAMLWLLQGVALWAVTSALLSLWFAEPLALWASRGRQVDTPRTPAESDLLETLADLAKQAGIPVPGLAIFPGEPNSFSAGRSRRHALVAVSREMLNTLGQRETRAVLAHEIAHIANGDMVTLGLLQGMLNGFAVWPALLVDAVARRLPGGHHRHETGPGISYWICFLALFFLCFGPLAGLIGAAFSKSREYRADRMAVALISHREHLSSALNRLATLRLKGRPGLLACHYIVGIQLPLHTFSTHPDFTERLRALKAD